MSPKISPTQNLREGERHQYEGANERQATKSDEPRRLSRIGGANVTNKIPRRITATHDIMTARSVVGVTRAGLTSVNQLRREVASEENRLDLIKSVAGETPSKDFAALIHEHEQKLSDLRERLDAQKRWLTAQLSATFATDSLRLRVAKLHFVDGLSCAAVGQKIFYTRQYVRSIVRAVEKILVPT